MSLTTTAHAHQVSTSQGEVELPIRYWDVSTAAAVFRVPAETAAELTAPLSVAPVRVGDHALAGLVFYEYRHTSVGAYNEVGLTVVSAPPHVPGWRLAVDPLRAVRRRDVGWAVLDLPVTTELANAAGREIWGYPKFVTELPIRFAPHAFHGQVRDPDRGRRDRHPRGGARIRGPRSPPGRAHLHTPRGPDLAHGGRRAGPLPDPPRPHAAPAGGRLDPRHGRAPSRPRPRRSEPRRAAAHPRVAVAAARGRAAALIPRTAPRSRAGRRRPASTEVRSVEAATGPTVALEGTPRGRDRPHARTAADDDPAAGVLRPRRRGRWRWWLGPTRSRWTR
jgi:hypothetical protein